MIFPISLIAFKEMRKKVMFRKKDTVSFYCVNISLRTNIHRGGGGGGERRRRRRRRREESEVNEDEGIKKR